MSSLNRYEKVLCENCGTQIIKLKIARHQKDCSAGTLYSAQYPNFSTKSQNDMNYHIAKKHSAPKPDITFKCKTCVCRNSRLLCFTSKTLSMDHKWHSERANLMWRIKWEMLMIKVSEKN